MKFAAWIAACTLALGCAVAAGAEGPSARPNYQIGPGDIIEYSVLGVENFSATSRVSNSGRIHAPHLGIIEVAGATPKELEQQLETEMKDRGLVNDPHVRVSVVEIRARPVYILGEVMNPGQFVITDRMFVSDLISLSQGFNEVASPVGYLYRRKEVAAVESDPATVAAQGTTVSSTIDEAIPIDFEKMYADSELNMELRGGDVLYVPERTIQYFYVIGDVYGPGRLELPEGGPVFASRALGMANGPLKTAKLKDSMVVTRLADGSLSYETVDLKKILKGEAEDFVIQPGQIVFVPGSITKSLGQGLLNALPGMAVLR